MADEEAKPSEGVTTTVEVVSYVSLTDDQNYLRVERKRLEFRDGLLVEVAKGSSITVGLGKPASG